MKMTQKQASAWQKLASDAIAEVRNSPNGWPSVSNLMIREGLNGDPSFQRLMAGCVVNKLLSEQTLTSTETFWLITTLGRLAASPKAALALSGKRGSGRAKVGAKGLQNALAVIEAFMDEGAVSAEQAWQLVADRNNVSFSTVKSDWMTWKGDVEKLFQPAIESDGAAIDLEGVLKKMASNNKCAIK